MRYRLTQKVFSLKRRYLIDDHRGFPAYEVVGNFFSIGHSLSFQTTDGVEKAQIRQRMLTLMPKYDLYIDHRFFASIIKHFTWFKNQFTLDVPGPNDYTITGSFWDYEYQFERRGQIVARVSKKFWSFSDTYGIEIDECEDPIAILATTVVISLCCHERADTSVSLGDDA